MSEILKLKAEAYDLIIEVEKLEAIKKDKLAKVNILTKQIYELEQQCQNK